MARSLNQKISPSPLIRKIILQLSRRPSKKVRKQQNQIHQPKQDMTSKDGTLQRTAEKKSTLQRKVSKVQPRYTPSGRKRPLPAVVAAAHHRAAMHPAETAAAVRPVEAAEAEYLQEAEHPAVVAAVAQPRLRHPLAAMW